YAEIADGDAAKLASAASGSAYIIWKETGTGVKWAVVAMHAAASAEAATDADLIKVKHTTAGTTCPQGGILQISSVVLAGDGSIDYVNCVRPTDVNKPNVLVAQEQIAYNAYGCARVAGLTELYTTAYASLAVGDLVGSWPNSFEAVARQDEFTHQIVHKESNRIWGVRVDPGFGATVGGRVLRVKAKADAGASTGLSVIRVDLNNTEIGSSFTVYTVSGTNWNTLWPRIANGDYLLASFIGQRWYGLPPFGSVGSC
ncbi:MAG TPA: hypothetical protein VM223_16810, partial [Planctomycetota bacterium]|nr:hypothetical protein [Planctomycetota bacterium]